MEEYAEELRTPPVALVSLVGMPELHQTISASLHSEQPPINTLALPDFGKISIIAPKVKEAVDSGQSAAGILKREWLAKHRTRVPAVVAALFSSDGVTGDPAQWLQVCTILKTAVVRGRNIKLVVVIVQSSLRDEVSDDHMTALKKRGEIDSKYITTFLLSDTLEKRKSLQRLAAMFAELSNTYYREEGRRIKTRIEKKSWNCAELHIRYCFKVAVFAEFRRDWAEALRFYNDAYGGLHETDCSSFMSRCWGTNKIAPIQRLVEIKTVAEYLHFKVSTLLLHGGKVDEAIKWFHKHIASCERLVGLPEVAFLHWEWMSRQFLVFAELLETSSAVIPSSVSANSGASGATLTEWDFQPAYYYQMSAHYLRKKKDSLEASLSAPETSEWRNPSESTALESIVPSIFVGQFSRVLEEGDLLTTLPVADAEYASYALAEAKRFQDSFEIIALYRKASESFTASKATRMASFCSNRMAREYYDTGDFTNAKRILDDIVGLYRRERWVALLWEALGYLRECSRKLGLLKEFAEYSLEMAALPLTEAPNGGGLSQRGVIQEEVDAVSPLRTVFLASVAFHDQSVKPGAPATLTLSLLSRLPQPVEIDQLEIQFNQPACNFTLSSSTWLRLTHEIQSGQSGKLECLSVAARIAPWCRIRCQADSPASMEASPSPSPHWKMLDEVQNSSTGDPILSAAGQKIIQIEEPDPQVDLILASSGPALVGEIFSVPVSVISRGHSVFSGELKINLVDAKGGGLITPREAEAAAGDGHHVELLAVSGTGEEEDDDDIKRIRHSFGLVAVPTLAAGESWSGKLEIKWHRPRTVMLYVSLGYSTSSGDGGGSAGQRVNVHRNLQIEGKTPLVLNHRFISPFRCEPLLVSKLRRRPDGGGGGGGDPTTVSLPQSEATVLIVSALNCCDVPLRCVSLSVEDPDGGGGGGAAVQAAVRHGAAAIASEVVAPGEEFKQFFSVVPPSESPGLELGHRRGGGADSAVVVRQKLPEVKVEKPPLVVKLEFPPYAVLGDPLTFHVKVQNQTSFLQEIKYSLGDSQSFVFSGPHQDKASVLPRSEHVVSHKVVPLGSGPQRLPHVNVTAVRYSAKVSASAAASTVFVFPSPPHLDPEEEAS
ncbi:unnamed protein product [Spirodela intermedia]|uniref:Trafficking protein particle complex subunit 11 domain-containing protein n=1 Tax=Spirodela intermedia TaxID=51605 RepID=A0A7I8IWT2_SPIIN|nr:unnamed protein product [Spirodela intermedia]CAA6661611.1 unnamed protein product [Spirodela intermedia]